MHPERDVSDMNEGDMRDTCRIHAAYMYPKRLFVKIHVGYMRDTCGMHAKYILIQDTYL